MKNTLKKHSHFEFGPDSRLVVTRSMVVKMRKKMFDIGKYGITASKRTFKLAVDRNRAKRLLRAWMRNVKLPEDHDIVFVARTNTLTTPQKEGIKDMKDSLRKLKNGKGKPPEPPRRRSKKEKKAERLARERAYLAKHPELNK